MMTMPEPPLPPLNGPPEDEGPLPAPPPPEPRFAVPDTPGDELPAFPPPPGPPDPEAWD